MWYVYHPHANLISLACGKSVVCDSDWRIYEVSKENGKFSLPGKYNSELRNSAILKIQMNNNDFILLSFTCCDVIWLAVALKLRCEVMMAMLAAAAPQKSLVQYIPMAYSKGHWKPLEHFRRLRWVLDEAFTVDFGTVYLILREMVEYSKVCLG